MKKQPDQVICEKCVTIVGTVYEIEDPARPGFYRNECKPSPLPPKCLSCHGPLTRIIGAII